MVRRPIRRGGLDWRYARVGVLVIAALVILVYIAYRVGDIFDLWTTRYELVTLFPSVTGLSRDAPVTVAGARVGRVVDIELVPADRRVGDANVLVRFWLATDVREQIRADSRARLRLQGLLGDRFIDIEPGSAGEPILLPGDTVIAIAPVELEEHVLEPTAAILHQMRIALEDVQRFTGGLTRGEGTLGRLLADDALYFQLSGATRELHALLRDANRAEGTLHRLLHDPELYERLTAALDRFDEAGRMILDGEGTLARLLTDDAIFERIVALLASADLALGEVAGALTLLTEGEGTLPMLLRDPLLYDQLLKAVIDAQYLIAQIRADPRQIRPQFQIRLFR